MSLDEKDIIFYYWRKEGIEKDEDVRLNEKGQKRTLYELEKKIDERERDMERA